MRWCSAIYPAALVTFTVWISCKGDYTQCSMDEWPCNGTNVCIEKRKLCNDVRDCEMGDDEMDCSDHDADEYWNQLFPKRPDEDWHREVSVNGQQNKRCDSVNVPTECICTQSMKIFCKNKELRDVPSNIPATTTVLDISGNRIDLLRQEHLSNLTNLKELLIMQSDVVSIAHDAFRDLAELTKLHLQSNLLTKIPNALFENTSLREISLSYNSLGELRKGYFKGLHNLKILRLDNCGIKLIEEGTFSELPALQQLYLGTNRIGTIVRSTFDNLSNLRQLYLNENSISMIEAKSFLHLTKLRHLVMHGNFIKVIKKETFLNLKSLLFLDLNTNKIASIEAGSMSSLRSLTSLDLSQNKLTELEVPFGIFRQMKNLSFIYFDDFTMCVYALHVRNCYPKGDGISSMENLLENGILRISVWVVASLACIGNFIVLLGRILIKEDNQIHSFFIKNLALSDLFMGIYLFIIASKDIMYRGEYLLKLKTEWRGSWQCNLAGVLSTVSSEVSVLTLTVITFDRYISIMYPLHLKKRSIATAYTIMLVIWLLCCVLTTMPLFPSDYFGDTFYSSNGVCLPLHVHNPYENGWEYSLFLFVAINFAAFLFISYAYALMFATIRRSQMSLRSTQENQETSLMKRFFFIVMTDFICWIPIIIIKIAALSGAKINKGFYGWVAIFILPVNSALNPILYTLTTKLFKKHFMSRVYRVFWRSNRPADAIETRASGGSVLVRRISSRSSQVVEFDSIPRRDSSLMSRSSRGSSNKSGNKYTNGIQYCARCKSMHSVNSHRPVYRYQDRSENRNSDQSPGLNRELSWKGINPCCASSTMKSPSSSTYTASLTCIVSPERNLEQDQVKMSLMKHHDDC
ncbi:unnamed protein product [Owenia fusiformis]|uniref:Uncharacterized protein n=1 Tax=Owenia fusiformis TaxID=6347 RepID=A0A8J1TC29_OWEFU|nr:unnamed protein product [Owenia fusiformis]